jgi:AraC-like DNA-binding protein
MNLRVGKVADSMPLSERQLHRKLKSMLDMNPAEYLRHYRLLKLIELLNQGQKPTYVSLSVGFSSGSYLASVLKPRLGSYLPNT